MPVNSDYEKSKKAISALILSILAILFLFSRAAYLDNDLPYRVLHSYAVIDEFYYTIPGFNLFHYGVVNPSILSNVMEEKNPPTNITQNSATYLTLKLFGNNFYGLRMGSVFCSLLIFVFFYFLLKRLLLLNNMKISEKPRTTIGLMLLFPLMYLFFDFSFLAAGRVAEPTIYRMLALVIMLYIGSFIEFSHIKPWQSFLLGFLAFAAVSFVYIYNAFIYAAFGLTVFIGAFRNGVKNTCKHTFIFVLGTILCLLLYQVYADVVYDSSLLEVYRNLVPFQSRVGVGSPGIESYLTNITLLWMTNIFRFNIILLFIFLISISVFIDKIRKFRSDFDILLVCLMGFLILQSIIINDYSLRKLLVMLPLILLISLQAYVHAPSYFQDLTLQRQRLNKIYWLLIWIINILVLLFYVNINLNNDSKPISDYFMVLNTAVFLFGTIILSRFYIYSIKVKKIVTVVFLISILVPNAFLDCRYIFLNRTTIYRDTMIAMADKIDDKIIVGGVAYAFRLYNTSVPILNFYTTKYSANSDSVAKYDKYFDQLFTNRIGAYSIGITGAIPDEDTIGINYLAEHNLKLKYEYNCKEIIDVNIGLFAPQ